MINQIDYAKLDNQYNFYLKKVKNNDGQKKKYLQFVQVNLT